MKHIYSPVRKDIKRNINYGFNTLMSINYNDDNIDKKIEKGFKLILDSILTINNEQYSTLKTYEKMISMGDFYLENFLGAIVLLSRKIIKEKSIKPENEVVIKIKDYDIINYNIDIERMSSSFLNVLVSRGNYTTDMFYSMLTRLAYNYFNGYKEYNKNFYSQYVINFLKIALNNKLTKTKREYILYEDCYQNMEKDMTTEALDFKNSMDNTDFMFYPVIVMEENFVPSTNDHVKRQKETNKFMKRLNKMSPYLEEIWEQQLKVKTSMHDFKFMSKTVFNDHGFLFLLGLYAKFDIELQKLNGLIKNYSKQYPEIKSYYDSMKTKVEYDRKVFDMMCNDMNYLIEQAQYKQDNTEKLSVDINILKGEYKNKLKLLK